MTPWLDDGDIRLYHGDALQVLRQLPDESVDCVVTSPPYWGLRDYGTGEWDGGDPDCDHTRHNAREPHERKSSTLGGGTDTIRIQEEANVYRETCGKCGARRIDQQLGLEATPDLFVAGMVELFREVRRVLAAHGTCWVNLGDSYSGGGGYAPDAPVNVARREQGSGMDGSFRFSPRVHDRQTVKPKVTTGLKPKDLVGIPWRVAFALQQDGWWLRSDIIWAKPNPMPESVTDRPTKAHEYLFLLTKQPRYWFDAEAVREPAQDRPIPAPEDKTVRPYKGPRINNAYAPGASGYGHHPNGRNVRSVWQIATQPYPEAHFATYPEELARRAILAGCPLRVCRVCGKPSERIVERGESDYAKLGKQNGTDFGRNDSQPGNMGQTRTAHGTVPSLKAASVETVGWTDCGHNNWRPGTVLDPFIGSGTTAKVARDHQRHAIGIDLNVEYLELAARRLQQLSLLT